MNDSGIKPQPYDRLLYKALECLQAAAEALRNGDHERAAVKQNEATSLMVSYDIMYGHNL